MFENLEQLVTAFEQGKLSRRALMARLGAVMAAVAGSRRALAAEGGGKPTFQATGLNHIALRVKDVPKARDFYVKHLGLAVTRDSPQSCFLSCGEHFVALFKSEEAELDHYCFTIPNYDPSAAVDTLKAAGLSPVRRENRVYFPDADRLELQVSGRNE